MGFTRPYGDEGCTPDVPDEKGSRLRFTYAFLLSLIISLPVLLGFGEGAYKLYRQFNSAGRETSLTASQSIRSTQSIEALQKNTYGTVVAP